MDPRDNPMYGLLQSRRDSVWDLGLVAATLAAALVGLKAGPQFVSALFVLLFCLVRSYRDSSRLLSLVQGRGIEEALMARTSVYDLLDGTALYCLRASAVPGLCFWLWLVSLNLLGGNLKLAVLTLAFWLPCLVVTLVSCCYAMQLNVTGTTGKSVVSTVVVLLWAGLLLGLAVVLATGDYRGVGVVLACLAGVAWLARRNTGSALLARLTPQPSVVRRLKPYRPWWPPRDAIELREACREHHRGTAWIGWLGIGAFTLLACALGEETMFFLLVLILPPWLCVWAAYRTSPAVIQEREARTFDVIALTRLRSEHFVDGWASHGWRPLAWHALVPTLGLGWTMISISVGRTVEVYLGFVLIYWAFLTSCAQAGAYVGLWASARAKTRNGLSGLVLGGCAGVGVFLVAVAMLLSLANPYALLIWFCLAGPTLAWFYRWETLQQLTVDGARSRPRQSWFALLLFGLAIPGMWPAWLAGLTFAACLWRLVRTLPGWLVGLALLGAPFIVLPQVNHGHRSGGQLTACKSNLKNIGTALEMYSTDFAGRYPTSSALLTPNYLKTIPTCPSAGKCTYVFQMACCPDLYTVVCGGDNHGSAGIKAPDYPQYTSVTGLIERP